MPVPFVESLRDVLAGLRPVAGGARNRLVGRRVLAGRSALLPAVLSQLLHAQVAPSVGWTIRDARWSDTHVAIVPIGPPGEAARLIVKFADPGPALDALQAQQARLARLHADTRLADWVAIVPRVLHAGTVDGIPFFVETALDGVAATSLFGEPRLKERLLPLAAEAIAGLHERTAVVTTVDGAKLHEWIDVPKDAIAAALPRGRAAADALHTLEDVGRELKATLSGRETSTGWIHGDYWPGNILATADGSRISGIVDWDLAADGQLPLHDPVHLVLLTRRMTSGREFGDLVRGLLAGEPLDQSERRALAAAGLHPAAWERDARESVLLAWLRHVGFFAQVPTEGSNPRWVRRNILAVLEALPGRRVLGGRQ